MKTLEQLKKMIEDWKEEHKNDEYFEEYKNYNFAAYNFESNNLVLFESYNRAKNYAEFGGQVLVIDKEKIYTYKTKTEEEIQEYVANEVRRENFNKRNFYGL